MTCDTKTKLVHRLREVRQLSKVSLRSLSRRTGIPISTLRRQEESNDVNLLDLQLWKEALGVPYMELFNDSPERMDEMTRLRAGLIQVMRAVKSLKNEELSETQQAILHNMTRDLESMMPELSEIGSWPQYGGKRKRNEPARVEAQIIATSLWCPDIGNEV